MQLNKYARSKFVLLALHNRDLNSLTALLLTFSDRMVFRMGDILFFTIAYADIILQLVKAKNMLIPIVLCSVNLLKY